MHIVIKLFTVHRSFQLWLIQFGCLPLLNNKSHATVETFSHYLLLRYWHNSALLMVHCHEMPWNKTVGICWIIIVMEQ